MTSNGNLMTKEMRVIDRDLLLLGGNFASYVKKKSLTLSLAHCVVGFYMPIKYEIL